MGPSGSEFGGVWGVNTAVAERTRCVFSLLEAMFGTDQLHSLADLIQGALMLRYNERVVG